MALDVRRGRGRSTPDAGRHRTGGDVSALAVSSASSTPIVVRNVSREFPRVGRVLDGLDLTIEAGSFVSLVGPSGCGKSTLLRLILDLDVDYGGAITFGEGRTHAAVSIAFQEPRLLPWRSVRGNLELVADRGHDRGRIDELLQLVDLRDFAETLPRALSGGMAQRVSLARALVNEPEVLLLDEPFSALDALTRMRLQEALLAIHLRQPRTTLLVTHDIDEALFVSDRVLVMSNRPGRIIDDLRVSPVRPRDRADPELLALKARVLAALGHDDRDGRTVAERHAHRTSGLGRPIDPDSTAWIGQA
jgi:ABC-type nitrate/sulfonate/bicarbonate transport system ATPase subunit